ncbi:MAG TPA: hypothetical protein VH479_11810 [Acidimicrobiales bacterium]|jgi:hypothetical protein
MRAGFVRPLAGAATVTGLAVGSPGAAAGVAAAATPEPAATPAAAAIPGAPGTTAAAATTYSWVYIRTPNQQRGSLLLVQDPLVPVQSWASGSGRNGHYDDCERSAGPIPYGSWPVIDTSANWPGSAVRGPVLRLHDAICHDGVTRRTELFVHSTYPWSAGHYQSEGCVKVSSKGTPSTASGDVRAVYDAYFKHGRPTHFVVAFGS